MKRLLYIILLLCLTLPAYGQEQVARLSGVTLLGGGVAAGTTPEVKMKQKLISGYSTLTSSAGTRYMPLSGGELVDDSDKANQLIPTAGTLRKFKVRISGDPTTGSSKYTFTVYRGNGATSPSATAMTCEIAVGQTTCTYDGDLTVAPDDKVRINIVPTNTPATVYVSTIVEFQSDTANESILISTWGDTITANRYNVINGVGPRASVELSGVQVMPCAGTITASYGRLSTAPGAAAERTFQIRKNGSNAGTAFVFTNTDVAKNPTQNITVARGDTLTMLATTTAGSPASSYAEFGFVFKPTTDGEFLINGNSSSVTAATAVYSAIGGVYVGSATEILFGLGHAVQNDFTVKSMDALLSDSPGADKTLTITFRKATGPADVSATYHLAFTASTAYQAIDEDLTPTNGEMYGISFLSDAGSTGTVSFVSFRGYIAP